MSIQLPKGTRDFYPENQRIQNHIFDTWKQTCLRFGYEEYEGPMFEHLELYTGKSGDEIVSQLYHFEDKGGRQIALRPEMTPTLARLINQKGPSLKKPLKWFSMPRMFRYERAQKGRLREFFQLNMDIIGTDSVYAEADLLISICTMMQDFGLNTQDYVIGISSRSLLAAWLRELQIEKPESVYPALDKRPKISAEAFAEELHKSGLDATQIQKMNAFMDCRDLQTLKNLIHSDSALAALHELQQLFDILNAAGIPQESVQLDLAIVRGLAYYTGIVFEVFDCKRSMRAVAGGGRYDSLTERLGGQKMPCVGFGMGDVVLADLLADRGLLPDGKPQLDLYLATFQNNIPLLFSTATAVRQLGMSCNHALAPTKFKKQLDAANTAGAQCVLFVDSDQSQEGVFEYKNLTTGQQGVASLTDILREVKS